MSLAELQHQLRDAVITGSAAPVVPLLVGGRDATKRLGIHHRHYTTSLATAIVTRFPATAWLVGPSRLEEAARQFVQQHPPTAPCIAEYGGAFPAFLGAWPATGGVASGPAVSGLDVSAGAGGVAW